MMKANELYPLSDPVRGAGGKTGKWRAMRPILDKSKCNGCQLCWIYCSEGVITRDQEIDYDYCKGCGVCAEECPAKAIVMEMEADFEGNV